MGLILTSEFKSGLLLFEVAEKTNLKRKVIERLMARGRFPRRKPVRGFRAYLFDEDEIDAWFESSMGLETLKSLANNAFRDNKNPFR